MDYEIKEDGTIIRGDAPKSNNESNDSGISIALVIFIIISIGLGIAVLHYSSKASKWENHCYAAQEAIRSLQSEVDKQTRIAKSAQAQLESAQAQLDKLSRACGPIIITSVEIGNAYSDGTIETNYGNRIYSENTMYLKPKISYIGTAQRTITLYYRLYTPNGYLSTGDSSPSGYSTSTSLFVLKGEHETYLMGWGNDNKGNWSRGKHKLELWYANTLLFTKEFTIY